MKRLRSIRLINWYHFADEILPVRGSCLLLGDNGSGKSTILDAIQLALVADLTEVRFNKAANETGHRTLHGYVRWKLGSEDEQRPGQQRYGRGACTSYVMLDIADDEDPAGDFVCGVVMEASEGDSDVSRSQFVLPRVAIADVPALGPGDLVRTSRDFRAVLREMAGAKPNLDVGTYRDEVRHRLGALPTSFHRLLVKALAFKPLGQVRDFVFNYLLDPRPVDTESLQANLEHYKRLEAEAHKAEQRIRALDGICELGERIAQERRTAESHRYLASRGALDDAEDEVRRLEQQIADIEDRRAALRAEQALLGERLAFVDGERERVIGLLQRDPVFEQIRALSRDLETLRRELQEARDAADEARELLASQRSTLERLLSSAARDLRRERPELFSGDELTGTVDQAALIERVQRALAQEGDLGGRDLGGWIRRLDAAAQSLWTGRHVIQQELEDAKAEGKRLEEERAELEKGRQRYEDGPAALLHLLRQKLKGTREPTPLCDLVEVANERWRDAVEGYLNTRRFDVIVAPADFPRALSLYERHKRGYDLPGRGEVFISGVGLVDIERVQATLPRAEPHSLARQVATDDALARASVDHLLGDVICCESEQELRRHRRAVTDSVMVYQNHVARQTPRHVYTRHFIGSAARLRRRDEIDRRLGELAAAYVHKAEQLAWLNEAETACGRARTAAARLPDLLGSAGRVTELRGREATLARQLDGIDRRSVEALQTEKLALDEERRRTSDTRDHVLGEERALGERADALRNEQGRTRVRSHEARTVLDEAFAALDAALRAAYEARYAEERAGRAPAEIHVVFDRQARTIATRADNLRDSLVRLKTQYSNDYGFTGQTEGEGFADHAAEREMWRESRLPDYRLRIAKAKEEAIQQLAEDIIFRLRENLLRVRSELDTLNRALRDVPFGADRYSFTYELDPAHKDFYDLIMDAGRFERDSLFGQAALGTDTTRRTLQDLFERLVAGEARTIKSELEAKADYREYFDYDLKIHHADGHVSLYDRVAADKSGGETQTPYYIAVLASMYRLYRQTAPEQKPTCGLVLLDEAFSKMDGARIEATLTFARSLSLQLVLATPKERSELVAPRVETCLFVHKDPRSGLPTVLDFTKEFTSGDFTDAPAEERAARAAEPAAPGS